MKKSIKKGENLANLTTTERKLLSTLIDSNHEEELDELPLIDVSEETEKPDKESLKFSRQPERFFTQYQGISADSGDSEGLSSKLGKLGKWNPPDVPLSEDDFVEMGTDDMSDSSCGDPQLSEFAIKDPDPEFAIKDPDPEFALKTPEAYLSSMHRPSYTDTFVTSSSYPYPVKKKSNRRSELDVPVLKVFSPSALDADDVSEALTPSDVEDFDDLKSSLKILRNDERTLVFAICIDKEDDEKNLMMALRCNGGTAFGGYAHDLPRDSYLVRCTECVQLGQVPFSYIVTMANVGEWRIKVPIPEVILEKHLTPQNKGVLDELRIRWSKKRYDIHFVQMLGCN